ncbi:hypothetical protein ACWEOZ_39925 [Actinoplanes sp. NPDC004185]
MATTTRLSAGWKPIRNGTVEMSSAGELTICFFMPGSVADFSPPPPAEFSACG